MDLLKYVESLGIKMKKTGARYIGPCPVCGGGHRTPCANIYHRDKSRLHCFSCGFHGDAADLAVAVEGIPLSEALRRFGGGRVEATLTNIAFAEDQNVSPRQYDAVKQVTCLQKIKEAAASVGLSNHVGLQFLVKERGISHYVLEEAFEQGLLRLLPEERETKRIFGAMTEEIKQAGLWAGRHREWAAWFFRPVLFFTGRRPVGFEARLAREPRKLENGIEPKALFLGRKTAAPFVLPSSQDGDGGDQLIVVEGAIDALSVREMGWQGPIWGLAGAGAWSPKMAEVAAKRHKTILVGLDADEAGDAMARHIAETLRDNGAKRVIRVRPKGAKDWNDLLLQGAEVPF